MTAREIAANFLVGYLGGLVTMEDLAIARAQLPEYFLDSEIRAEATDLIDHLINDREHATVARLQTAARFATREEARDA